MDVDNKLKPPVEKPEGKHELEQTNGPTSNLEESGTTFFNSEPF